MKYRTIAILWAYYPTNRSVYSPLSSFTHFLFLSVTNRKFHSFRIVLINYSHLVSIRIDLKSTNHRHSVDGFVDLNTRHTDTIRLPSRYKLSITISGFEFLSHSMLTIFGTKPIENHCILRHMLMVWCTSDKCTYKSSLVWELNHFRFKSIVYEWKIYLLPVWWYFNWITF